jgi:hypothetical protein
MSAHTSRARAASRLWANDVELAKKDDDRAARHHHGTNEQWQAAVRTPRRRTVARLFAYLAVAFFIFFVLSKAYHSGSDGDAGSWSRQSLDAGRRQPPTRGYTGPADQERGAAAGVEKSRTYNGPIRLPKLGETLFAIADTNGKQIQNRNVLFAAASLKSASALLPLACRMALEKQNYVHFAFTGQSEVPLEELAKINGINDNEACPMIMHDARPDHAADSTEQRMALSSARAMCMWHNPVVVGEAGANEL